LKSLYHILTKNQCFSTKGRKATFSFLSSYLFSGKVARESKRKVKSEKRIVKSTKKPLARLFFLVAGVGFEKSWEWVICYFAVGHAK